MASFVIQQRALAGIRFVDVATDAPVRVPLVVRSVPSGRRVVIHPNRRNIHVLTAAEGFEEYAAGFEDIPGVSEVPIEMEVRDPSGIYLPREFTVTIPRDADPNAQDSVFEPVSVRLFRSPRASRSQNWALIRVRLEHGPDRDPVPAALLRVVHDPEGAREILGYGMSVVPDPEARELERRHGGGTRWVHFSERHVGEAGVPVVGLNSQIWAVNPGEDVVLTNITAALEVLPMAITEQGRLPDPSNVLSSPATPANSRSITLSVGAEINEQPFLVTLSP